MSSNATGTSRNLLTVVKNLWAVPWRATNPIALINENKGFLGVNMGHLWDERPRVVGWLAEILALYAAGHVRPHVHAAIPASRAAEAHQLARPQEPRQGRADVGPRLAPAPAPCVR